MPHIASTLLMFLLALLAGCALPTSPMPYAKVTSYGLFEMRKHPPTLGSLPSPAAGMSSFRLIQQTRRIPAEIGRGFGYCFLIHELTSDSVLIRQEVEHPPWLKADGTRSTGYLIEDTVKVSNGRANGCLGYLFDDPANLVPGVLRVKLSIDGRTLAVQELEIVHPDDL